jgi:hypothetical protein
VRAAGFVRDEGGRPIAGAVVAITPVLGLELQASPAAVTRSRGDGVFALGDLAPAVYAVSATQAGFLPAQEMLTLYPGDSAEAVALVLRRGGLTLSGHVRDVGGGVIAGAVVTVSDFSQRPAVYATVSDEAGVYRFDLASGQHRVLTRANGYAPAAARAVVGPEDRAVTLDLVLAPGLGVSGVVVEHGRPVANADVELHTEIAEADLVARPLHRRTTTRTDGTFELRDLEPGSYDLLARAGDRVGRLPRPLSVFHPGRLPAVTIAIGPGAALVGRVTGPGGALASSTVRLYEGDLPQGPPRELSTEDGRFRLDGLAPGRYLLTARRPGLARAERSLVIGTGDRRVELELSLSTGGAVDGQVLGSDGRPLAGAKIEARTKPTGPSPSGYDVAVATTGPDGRFVLDGLPSGVLRARVEHAAGLLVTQPLLVGPGRQQVTWTVHPAGFVTGVAHHADGSPAPGVTVTAIGPLDLVAQTRTGADGRYRLGPLPSRQTIFLAASAHESPDAALADTRAGRGYMVELDDGGTESVDPEVKLGGLRIAGVVRGPDGKPLVDALIGVVGGGARPTAVRAHAIASGGVKTLSGEDGSFAVDDLVVGGYEVWARYPGLPDVQAPGVAAGTSGIVLRFAIPGAIAGRVVRADHSPVADYDLIAVPTDPGPPVRHIFRESLSGDSPRLAVHDRSGQFDLAGLKAGHYSLYVLAGDRSCARVPLDVDDGAPPRDLVIQVGSPATVTGRVVDEHSGQPLAGVRIEGMSSVGRPKATTDASGAFRLEPLVPGSEVFFAFDSPTHYSRTVELVIPPGASGLEGGTVRLPPR